MKSGQLAVFTDEAGSIGSAVDSPNPVRLPKAGVLFGDTRDGIGYKVNLSPHGEIPNVRIRLAGATALSVTPRHLEFCSRDIPASIISVRLDSEAGAQGVFQQQALNSKDRFFSVMSIKGSTSSNVAGEEEGSIDIFEIENGKQVKVLSMSREAVEICGDRALMVNGSVGNPGDVLCSQGKGKPPIWKAPG